MPTVTIAIAVAADDGEDNGGLPSSPNTWQSGGLGSNFAYVFQDAGSYEWWNGSFLIGAGENLPAAATINSAYLSGLSGNDNSGTRDLEIALENADPATNTAWSNAHLSLTATLYGTTAAAPGANWGSNIDVLGQGETNETDIGPLIQLLVNDYGAIDVGDRINLVMRPTAAPSGNYVSMGLFERGGANIAELTITFNEGVGGGFNSGWARLSNQVIA